MNSWAILDVDEFPNRNQITLGGNPYIKDKSTKSESKVPMLNPLDFAHFQISRSCFPSKPASRSCFEPTKMEEFL